MAVDCTCSKIANIQIINLDIKITHKHRGPMDTKGKSLDIFALPICRLQMVGGLTQKDSEILIANCTHVLHIDAC